MTYAASPQQNYPPAGEPPLDQPWYGIGFGDAVKRGFKKYAVLSGRASRGEFWWWSLATLLILFVPGILFGGITAATQDSSGSPSPIATLFGLLLIAIWLALVVPSIAVTVRRLHDANYSGAFYFLTFIPSVGGVILLVLCAMQSNPMGVRFDPGYTPNFGGPVYGQPPYGQIDPGQQGYQGYARPGNTYPQQYGQPPTSSGSAPDYGRPPTSSGSAPDYGQQQGWTPPPSDPNQPRS